MYYYSRTYDQAMLLQNPEKFAKRNGIEPESGNEATQPIQEAITKYLYQEINNYEFSFDDTRLSASKFTAALEEKTKDMPNKHQVVQKAYTVLLAYSHYIYGLGFSARNINMEHILKKLDPQTSYTEKSPEATQEALLEKILNFVDQDPQKDQISPVFMAALYAKLCAESTDELSTIQQVQFYFWNLKQIECINNEVKSFLTESSNKFQMTYKLESSRTFATQDRQTWDKLTPDQQQGLYDDMKLMYSIYIEQADFRLELHKSVPAIQEHSNLEKRILTSLVYENDLKEAKDKINEHEDKLNTINITIAKHKDALATMLKNEEADEDTEDAFEKKLVDKKHLIQQQKVIETAIDKQTQEIDTISNKNEENKTKIKILIESSDANISNQFKDADSNLFEKIFKFVKSKLITSEINEDVALLEEDQTISQKSNVKHNSLWEKLYSLLKTICNWHPESQKVSEQHFKLDVNNFTDPEIIGNNTDAIKHTDAIKDN